MNYPDERSNPLRGARLYLNGQEVKEIVIPENVTHIGKYTFYEFNSLTSIIIPNSVTTIEDCAFYGCSGLTNVTIPNSVKSIGNEAFENCNNLTSLTIPNSVTNILKRAFQGCSSLSSIIIPNSVTTITTGLFAGCKGLKNITIPHSVTSIGDKAFSGCSGLSSICIGNSVTYIGGTAFASCPSITDVYCYAPDVPYTSSDAFKESYADYITLHVPESAMERYKTSSPWNVFKDFVALPNYKLTYIVDGETYKTYKYEEDRKIPVEPSPIKEGYSFSGWSEIPETMPDHDVEVTGTFTVNTYTLTYIVDFEVYKTVEIEYGAVISPEAVPEKEGYVFSGWGEIPETMPAHNLTVSGTFLTNSLGKCSIPTIAYKNGKLKFTCETEGVKFVSEVTASDAKKYYDSEVPLTGVYHVTAYAMKTGYDNSDVATADFVVIGSTVTLVGDVDGNGTVDATDLTKLIDILLKR